ncbi:MAG: arylesterase [Acidobacteria bacterium]|nr:arylesterase [Acidobacteriota bacterium]
MRLRLTILLLAACGAVACASPDQRASAAASDGAPSRATSAAPPAARPRIVVLGDSLTFGLGLPSDESYPAILQRKLDQAGYRYEVVNAGVSGETSAGGLRRLDWALGNDARILILALGGNDGLRGIPVESMKANLSAIIEGAKRRGAAVLLAGMEAPPNLGNAYTGEFRGAFREVAQQQAVPLLPFLLQGVAGVASLNQGDRIHPNREGARLVAEHVWRSLEPIVREDAARR